MGQATTVSKPTQKELVEHVKSWDFIKKIREGNYELGEWFTKPLDDPNWWGSWGIKAKPSARGLTLMDINKAEGKPIPDVAPAAGVARGAVWPEGSPPRQWPLSEKWEIWADNVVTLFEEGTSRQWSATRDIPWEKLTPLPPDVERAYCQFLTFLTTGEYQANDGLTPWLHQINTQFHEVKFFLYQQMTDEVRHSEVFRKRALAGGGGLGVSTFRVPGHPAHPATFTGIQLSHQDFSSQSYFLHVLAEGVFLDNFRFGEYLSQTEVDKEIFRLVMQDEARHVSYGVMRLKYALEHAPDREAYTERMHNVADWCEMYFLENHMVNRFLLEPYAIMAAGGVNNIDRGYETYRQVYARIVAEYLNRCDRAGFPRRGRCYMPEDPPF